MRYTSGMKTLVDPNLTLAPGLAAIRQQFRVPESFPPAVLSAAEAAARRTPTEHVDRTDRHFVTLDPATSTDLDQAFAIEAAGADFLLHYAIADVAWFVTDGDPIDAEAWTRGETIYLPDGKAPLYPPVLSQGAASLLPDGPRPAVVFTVRIAPDGSAQLDGAERAIVRSRAKLAYDGVDAGDLPNGFAELAARVHDAEERRGAARVDPPEQEVEASGAGFMLAFRPRLASEDQNAALSLATNLAIADVLLAHRTGLFRVMAGPTEGAVRRLRFSARALGLHWSDAMDLRTFERTLDPALPAHAAFMTAIRRAGNGASYEAYRAGVTPWHAPMAASYVHATAPLRRLADRYVVQAALAVANGRAVPDVVEAAFEALPPVMARAGGLSGQVERAVVDLAEAVMLQGHEGATFDAVVTDIDDRGARFQLCDLPVLARAEAQDVVAGDAIRVMLERADPQRRAVSFRQLAETPSRAP